MSGTLFFIFATCELLNHEPTDIHPAPPPITQIPHHMQSRLLSFVSDKLNILFKKSMPNLQMASGGRPYPNGQSYGRNSFANI